LWYYELGGTKITCKMVFFNDVIRKLKKIHRKQGEKSRNIGYLQFTLLFYLQRMILFCFQFLRAERKVFQSVCRV